MQTISKQRLLAPEVRLPKDKLQVGHMVYSYAYAMFGMRELYLQQGNWLLLENKL